MITSQQSKQQDQQNMANMSLKMNSQQQHPPQSNMSIMGTQMDDTQQQQQQLLNNFNRMDMDQSTMYLLQQDISMANPLLSQQQQQQQHSNQMSMMAGMNPAIQSQSGFSHQHDQKMDSRFMNKTMFQSQQQQPNLMQSMNNSFTGCSNQTTDPFMQQNSNRQISQQKQQYQQPSIGQINQNSTGTGSNVTYGMSSSLNAGGQQQINQQNELFGPMSKSMINNQSQQQELPLPLSSSSMINSTMHRSMPLYNMAGQLQQQPPKIVDNNNNNNSGQIDFHHSLISSSAQQQHHGITMNRLNQSTTQSREYQQQNHQLKQQQMAATSLDQQQGGWQHSTELSPILDVSPSIEAAEAQEILERRRNTVCDFVIIFLNILAFIFNFS